MTYQPTPEQHRAEDAPMGYKGVGHYDTGTVIKLAQGKYGWCACTDTAAAAGDTADKAIRALSEWSFYNMRQASDPASIVRYAAVIAAAEQLTGYVPRAIARRGKR
jgi:hypothetical protein